MIKRIILAAILGGAAVFMWEFVAHMILPLGQAGIKGLSNESAVMTDFKANISEPGFYFFPAPDQSPGASKEQQEEIMRRHMEKMRNNPVGVMVIHPQGMEMQMGRRLGMQFAFDVVAMLVAAILLSRATAMSCYGRRLMFVTMLGLLPTLVVELPLWNWYGFPTTYMVAQAVVHLVAFLAGGLVIAGIVRPIAKA